MMNGIHADILMEKIAFLGIRLSIVWLLEKARAFDPFGHAGLTPLGEIRMTLAGEIKMTPVEASAGEFFCSFEIPCPGTAGINLKNYRI